MTTSSEDVLRLIENVRVKKNDGTLYIMAERIAWMPNGKDTFTISHKYADIKTQKISPEGKPKIQLQVVLNNNASDTFHFVNPNGVQSQLQDRNEVKELLQQLLPKFKQKLSKEIEEKSRILTDNPELYQLYKELVISNVISAEEFWANYAAKKRLEFNAKLDSGAQEVGVSAAFLADVRPQADGSNGIKYNITSEIIESIFNTYPAVKRKHFESVPHKMSEQEFWQRFFQSHYFHRDRSSATKDFFSDCVKNDDLDVKRALKRGIVDPFVDISSFEDGNVALNGLGSNSLDINDNNSKIESSNLISSSNQALIRRFNHHSMMILDSCLNKSLHNSLPAPVNGVINKKSKSNSQVTTTLTPIIDDTDTNAAELERECIKRQRLMEKTELEDLNDSDGANMKVASLKIANKDRYLTGPTPNVDCDMYSSCSTNGYNFNGSNGSNNLLQSYFQQNLLITKWKPTRKRAMQSKAAIYALSELSPGGALMKSTHNSNLKDEVQLDVQKELKNLTFSLNELLKHFWSCFPTTTPQLEEKLIQMRETIERFQYTKLQPFVEKLSREYRSCDLTSHLMQQIQVAYNRYNSWHAKRNVLNRK